ncbi:MAG: hypothetical protein AAF961_19445, partial [Planctomycetota bacterium]
HLRMEAFHWLIEAERTFDQTVADRDGVAATLATGHWLMGQVEVAEQHLRFANTQGHTASTAWAEFLIRGGQARFAEAFEHWQRFERLAEASGSEIERRWARSAYSAHVAIMGDPKDSGIDTLLSEIAEYQRRVDWPTGVALLHSVEANLAIMRQQHADATGRRRLAIDVAATCGSRFIEMFAKTLIGDDERDSSREPHDRLRVAAADFRSLIETRGELQMPMAARALVVAMIACGELETAARCSTTAESLRGLGDNNEYSHEYLPALERLRAELGEARFERLRSDGRRLAPSDLAGIAEALVVPRE